MSLDSARWIAASQKTLFARVSVMLSPFLKHRNMSLLLGFLLLCPLTAATFSAAQTPQTTAAAAAKRDAARTAEATRTAEAAKAVAAAKAALAKPVVPVGGPPMITHPHKVFADTVNNKLYWPMDKPFWVRLAVSPDADAPSFLLQRVTPESEITTEKYDKEGIALEIKDGQFIRWFNYVTKQNTNLEFFSDGEPPITKATCTGAPIVVDPARTFYGVGLHCSLASVDELSGVDTTYLSIDGAPYKPYTAGLTLDKEKDVVLRYYADDRVGWAETPQKMMFTVDLTPPVTTHAVAGNAIGYVLSSQARFTIASSDKLSGVATIHARFDKQDFNLIVNGQINVENLPDGDHTLSYYSIDRVENRETEHVIPFYLDRIPPTVGAEVVGDLSVASTGVRYVSSRSHVKLTAQDNKIGVNMINYSFEGSSFERYSDPFLLPAHSGVAKLSYKASDKLNNTSDVATLPYYMDLAPPQSEYHIVGSVYQSRSDFYITSASRIQLSSTDDASGVQKIEYKSEDAPDPQIYASPLQFANEGRRLLRYWGTDKVNNRELDRAVELITDNTPPDIFANFSLTATVAADAQGLPEYRRLTSLFLAATDKSSGVHKIYYTINGAKELDYSTPLLFDKEGTYEMTIRSDDNVGNQSTKQLRFVIKG
jgi:hypothetical protein